MGSLLGRSSNNNGNQSSGCTCHVAIASGAGVSAATAADDPAGRGTVGVGRPRHCRDRCGNISVPYPFGIDYGGGCHHHGPGFFLGCNDTYNPPRLHIHGIPNQIEALSLDAGEARVYYKATHECYDARGELDAGNATEGTVSFGTDDPWRFSADKNRLASFGCPNLGYWASAEAYYISGCMSVCQPKEDSIFSSSGSGPCTGVDCCQSTSCHYVFLAEAEWLNTNYREYLRRVDDFTVPLVLDWAIRNAANCSAAKSNTTDYACRSTNSRCVDSTNGPGYQCECEVGFEGNPFLDHGCGGVSVGVFLFVSMCFWLYLGLQKRKLIQTKQKFFEQNGGVLLQQQMRISEEELKKATDNFAIDRILGRGGHGIVYKGVLEDKATVVAIKKSKVMEAAQTKEFAKEMLILSQINHRNIVKLLGCCLEVEVPMLVYEFVSNGTLYHYIHYYKDLNTNNITFDTRLRIAAESAEALAYMHSSASPPILHGDVKTANRSSMAMSTTSSQPRFRTLERQSWRQPMR
ncbi:hypothetical protein PR202_gb22652 [Eleusine coracana subsp. coracana]|uniref:Protein kinase domain-containing protein n=1 Tax=Eleusine coracana subsp. coracana TaxID=191504 RepID=A0AAV5FID5_ELECO|nr:hypothetical protein PR202_gb22652 [Eleusine coracana subsp. coracana]